MVETASKSGKPRIELHHYADRRPLWTPELTLWDNHGWCVVAEQGDEELLIWTSPYVLKNATNGPFLVPAASVLQTTFLRVRYPADQKTSMHDNEFTSVGWDLADFLDGDALRIVEGRTQVTWEVLDRTYGFAPPNWFVRGAHAGLWCDLEFTPAAPAFWYSDPAADLRTEPELWVNQFARVRGEVRVAGRSYRIDGRGWHEHHTHLKPAFDPLTMNSGVGVNFHAGFGADVQVYAHKRSSGRGHGRAVLGDRVLHFDDPTAIALEPVELWRDPRSWFSVPSRWRVTMRSPEGAVDLRVSAYARAYYLWPYYRDGHAHQYWYLARAEGTVQPAGEAARSVGELKYVVNFNRAFYRRTGRP